MFIGGKVWKKLKGVMRGVNDFAIIHLQKEVSFNQKINSIPLPKEDAKCPSGEMPFVVSGWGKDRPKHPNVPFELLSSTRFLQAVKQECLNVSKCKVFKSKDLVWCIGDSSNLQNGICQGDSGGKMAILCLLIS